MLLFLVTNRTRAVICSNLEDRQQHDPRHSQEGVVSPDQIDYRPARMAEQGVSLRRPTKALRVVSSRPLETDHRATARRVAEGRSRENASRQPDTRTRRGVSFDEHVTVYPADDYDRRSPWMRMARDRIRRAPATMTSRW